MRKITRDDIRDVVYSVIDGEELQETLIASLWERMNHEPQIDKARRIASEAHEGQTDKGGFAYFDHVEWVAETFVVPEDEVLRVAGYLHDVVEDTPWTLEDLRDEGVSERAVEIVDALTRRDGETRADYLLRVAVDPSALRVKLADIAHNLQPARLEELDQDEVHRLIQKYANSLQVLAQGSR